jgi:hypothetical protein
MAGLVPAIHVFVYRKQVVDARHKAGHDDVGGTLPRYAATGFGCRAIASVINAATMHSAPAAKNAGR